MTDELEREVRICSVNEMKNAPDLQPLWGNWIFRNSVILQAGVPGLRKTTFNYAFSRHIADDEAFLGIEPVEKGYTIFIFDPESHDSLIKARMRGIGWPKDDSRLMICNDSSIKLPQLEPYIERQGIKPDIIFVDPIRVAFGTRDENDNAEAAKKATYLRNLAFKYHCAVFAVHHSSKADVSGTNKGAGAGALVALADISLNFDALGEGWPKNIFKMSMPKNRFIDDDFLVFIKAESKTFVVVKPPEGYLDGEHEGATVRYTIQQRIAQLLNPHVPESPQSIFEKLGSNCSKQAIHLALDNLLALGTAENPSFGKYFKNDKKPPT